MWTTMAICALVFFILLLVNGPKEEHRTDVNISALVTSCIWILALFIYNYNH